MCTRIAILICTCACTGCDLLAGMRRSAQVGQSPRGVELARHRMRRVGVLFEPQALARRLAAQALQPRRRPAARHPAGPRRGRGRRRPPGADPACPLHGCAAPADARRAASRPPSLSVRECMLRWIFICGSQFGCALCALRPGARQGRPRGRPPQQHRSSQARTPWRPGPPSQYCVWGAHRCRPRLVVPWWREGPRERGAAERALSSSQWIKSGPAPSRSGASAARLAAPWVGAGAHVEPGLPLRNPLQLERVRRPGRGRGGHGGERLVESVREQEKGARGSLGSGGGADMCLLYVDRRAVTSSSPGLMDTASSVTMNGRYSSNEDLSRPRVMCVCMCV